MKGLIPMRMAVIEKITANVGEDVKKSEPSYAACGSVNSVVALENNLALLQKVKTTVDI